MKLTVSEGAYAYPGSKAQVLSSISFSAEDGDLIAILGPNGAGKTTLLRCMMGFLPWKNGQSCIDDKDIRSYSTRQLWSIMAYVPQAKNAPSGYTVEELVLLGRSSSFGLLQQPKAADIQLCKQIMCRLHIEKLAQKKCSEISGGELQMALIAKALAAQPRILVLDEPESNLDFKNQLVVLQTISQLAQEGIICIFNTHYPTHALQRANKALLLDGSGTAQFGETHRIVTEKNIEKAFGVRAVIGEVETEEQTLHDIVPVNISDDTPATEQDEPCIAVLSVIVQDMRRAEEINAILHEYRQYLIGRMGLPYPQGGVNIINVTLDAPRSEMRALTMRLSGLQGVHAKTVMANKLDAEQEEAR